MAKRIKIIGETMKKVDPKLVAHGLGAKVVNISELTKEECKDEKYIPLGSPVMIPAADKLYIYHFGSRMLNQHGMSLDDVVGYRILEQDEELEFRRECGNEYATVVRYYGKK